MFENETKNKKMKDWPVNTPWPEPTEFGFMYDEDFYPQELDEDAAELLEIKEYYDFLVDEGRLDEDYNLNPDYPEDEDSEDDEDDNLDDSDEYEEDPDLEDDFFPDMGEEYWNDGFDLDSWREDFCTAINQIKIEFPQDDMDPVTHFHELTGYQFINENLLRQAFTRRAFAIEYGLENSRKREGCSEELEFLGDSILNMVVTKEIIKQFTEIEKINVAAPFSSIYDEGELTRIRTFFVSKDYLAQRARQLELDSYILYGSDEQPSESALEDMMEALIGAVTMDSNWNMDVLEEVINSLLDIQLNAPNRFLKKTYYEIFNAWHQQHFGEIPDFQVYWIDKDPNHYYNKYLCRIYFRVPENTKGIQPLQTIEMEGDTRSHARERAAELAYHFIAGHGLWINLEDAHIIPDFENSINQLQELYQKKYLSEKPEYDCTETGNEWWCDCHCCSYHGSGHGSTKVKAKKKAAYKVLVELLRSAGICEKEWLELMYRL